MSDDTPTLYNPPETRDDSSLVDGDANAHVSVSISLPADVYERLQAVAKQLGLPPTLVAARAVEMICDEIPNIEDAETESEQVTTEELIDRYQSRLDILQTTRDPED